MKWSEKVWNSIEPIYSKILDLDFIKELINGKLDKNKFDFYIQQDAIYVADYAKVLIGIATKLTKTEHIDAFVHFAADSVAVEKALHNSFLKNMNKINLEASPSCLLYTSYLLRQLAIAPIEVIVAAVLPCFWIYKEVGDYISANQIKENNPYQSWIDAYGTEEFAVAVKKAIDICDELANKCTIEQLEQMTKAFVMSSKFEYMFWDSAYKMEQWKI